MFYIITGNNENESLNKLQVLVKGLMVKYPKASIRRISAEDFEPNLFNELVRAEDLFTDKRLMVFKRLLTVEASKDFILAQIKTLAAAKHIFIFWEPALNQELENELKPLAVGFKKYKKKTEIITEDEKIGFRLSDKLSQKDKKGLWLTYHHLRQAGYEPEELFWLLYRQVKSLLLLKNTKEIKELKWHPFFFKNQQKFSNNFTKEELIFLMTELSSLYFKVMFENKDWDEAIEGFVFNI